MQAISTDVIRKLMFQVGLKTEDVEPQRSSIEKLKYVRNSIAHGDRIKVPTIEEVSAFLGTTREVMDLVQREITLALANETYRKTAESGQSMVTA